MDNNSVGNMSPFDSPSTPPPQPVSAPIDTTTSTPPPIAKDVSDLPTGGPISSSIPAASSETTSQPQTDQPVGQEESVVVAGSGGGPKGPRVGRTAKIAGAIVGVLLLVAGTGVGIYAIRQRQNPERSSAANLGVGDICPDNSGQTITKCARFVCPSGCGSDGQCGQGDPDAIYTESCESLNGQCGQVDYLNSQGAYCGHDEINCTGVCSGGGATPAPQKSVCGESCNSNSDCSGATTPGVNVVCRNNQCVNEACYNKGGQTNFGTQCTCSLSSGQCGEPCGGAIGLCDAGYSCTYAAQSLCSATNTGFCVPNGTDTSTGRGPMIGVQKYNGASFERKQCGAGTSDSENNYIYHPSFPNHTFTSNEVLQYICNPATPTPTSNPNIGGQCLEVKMYDTDWNELSASQAAQLQSGDQIYVTVRGSVNVDNVPSAIAKARFTLNGTLRPEVTTVRPGTSDEFYDLVTVPDIPTGEDSLTISIKGEVYHPDLGWF